MAELLSRLSEDLADTVDQAGPSVVRVEARRRLPASGIVGGAFLVLCDAASRMLFPVFTSETPVGVITAFVGGPMFVYLLRKSSSPATLEIP